MTDTELVAELRRWIPAILRRIEEAAQSEDGPVCFNLSQAAVIQINMSQAADTIEAQAAEIQRLREALRKYGQHLIRNGLGCFLADGTERCTCGLSDALAEG